MGSGGSRLKYPESIPARFRPILRRRIEEVQRRRRLGATKDESAKKELLLASGNPNDADCRKSNVGKEDDNVEERCAASSEGKEEREVKVVGEGGERKSDSRLTDLDDGDTDDGIVDDSSIIYPGSPSFRIYFVDHGDDNDSDDHSLETVKEEDVKEKIRSNDSDAFPEKEPTTETLVKKVRKKRSLKMVLTRGQVKNLLNVKGCYTPTHGVTRHDHSHLLSEKPEP